MTKKIKNVGSSVKGRLSNIAEKENMSFDLLLMLYMQERLLYRLSVSEYAEKFILKGGLLLYSVTDFKGRPTKDIDFLARHISNDISIMKDCFEKICRIKCNDGVIFDAESIVIERITEGADYQGIRVKLNGYIVKSKKRLQLDIGFGDVVVPKPIMMEYPVLLSMDAPKIKVYSIESVIAEKFEAMISLSTLNSRMKDFYDIYLLSNMKSFDGRTLQEAISETFQKRGTVIERDNILFSGDFAEDKRMKMQWSGFLKKIGKEAIEFEEVMDRIKSFLLPIYECVMKEEEFLLKWDDCGKHWDKHNMEQQKT